MRQTVEEILAIPDGVTVTLDKGVLTVKGPKGEIKRNVPIKEVKITLQSKEFKITAQKATKKEKTHLYSTLAHTKNMIKGVQKPYLYVLKICSGHFPINVSATGGNFAVKNFLGEKYPRMMPIKPGATITIQGDKITVESPDKELAGQVASDIELLTFISKRDQRIFQDGIYVIEKAGEPLK